ncbi:MAG: DUF5666 domain-containing protein, partial [Nitrospira sp.]|nr:DUF5666 domain-containing protein [Nitrospira sp.]
ASASATVTGFGSIYVNGKKFETDDVTVEQDGEFRQCRIDQADTCGVKKGMVVTVHGSLNGDQRTAHSISQKDAVEGLVQSISPDGLSLIVMGQTVLVDSTTMFENSFTPVVGQHVEVNGHIRPAGLIHATFIELKSAAVTPEVRGFVSDHVSGAATFKIGNLTVHYGGADIHNMPLPNGNNWDGRFVEVKGAGGAFIPGPDSQTEGTLTAIKVERENDGIDSHADEFEVEGFVTNVMSSDLAAGTAHFFIGTREVRTTDNTEFRGGTIDEIMVGAKLSAEGSVVDGVITADHVKFHDSIRVEGDIMKTESDTFTIAGLTSIMISINTRTDFHGLSGLADVIEGAHVRVRGKMGSMPSSFLAASLELRSPDSDISIQGPVQMINGTELVILGVSVDVQTIDHFKNMDGTSITRDVFLSTLTEQGLVKVKGTWNGAFVDWEEAKLED